MEDNKINGLELPLEYLDLPDDEALPLEEEEIEAFKPVVEHTAMESIPPDTEEATIATTTMPHGDDVVVYGLGLERRRDESFGGQRRIPTALFSAVAAALVLVVIGVVMVPRILAAREPEPELVIVEDPTPLAAPEPEPEPEPAEPGMGPNEIMALLRTLKHGETDASIDPGRISFSIRDGFLVVTQTLPDDAAFDATEILRLTSLRSNALSASLTGKKVATESGGEGSDFTGLTWIVQAKDKNAYLAIYETPGEVRASDETFGVLAGAQGYVLSASLYEALGGAESGISASAGTAPTNLDGKAVNAKAVVPEPAEEPEEEAPAEAESYADDGYSYNENGYAYEDTSDDNTYVEVVEDVTTDYSGPEPDAFVVPEEPEEPYEPEDSGEYVDGGEEAPAENPGD